MSRSNNDDDDDDVAVLQLGSLRIELTSVYVSATLYTTLLAFFAIQAFAFGDTSLSNASVDTYICYTLLALSGVATYLWTAVYHGPGFVGECTREYLNQQLDLVDPNGLRLYQYFHRDYTLESSSSSRSGDSGGRAEKGSGGKRNEEKQSLLLLEEEQNEEEDDDLLLQQQQQEQKAYDADDGGGGEGNVKELIMKQVRLIMAHPRFCSTCRLLRPLRSKHCRTCNQCIVKFDHHCPWMGSCVGYLNQYKFLLYLLVTEVSMFWCISITWEGMTLGSSNNNSSNVTTAYVFHLLSVIAIFIFIIVVTILIGIQVYMAITNQTTYQNIKRDERLLFWRRRQQQQQVPSFAPGIGVPIGGVDSGVVSNRSTRIDSSLLLSEQDREVDLESPPSVHDDGRFLAYLQALLGSLEEESYDTDTYSVGWKNNVKSFFFPNVWLNVSLAISPMVLSSSSSSSAF